MITRDFLLRQIHQFVQAIARAVVFRQRARYNEARDALEEAAGGIADIDLTRLRLLPRDELLAHCTADGELVAELAVALGDLFREDAALLDAEDEPETALLSLERALWCYEAALRSGGAIPFDLMERVHTLRDHLDV